MMGSPRIIIVENAKEVATTAADLVIETACQAVESRGVFHWCATGGSTPNNLYAALRSDLNIRRLPWPKTEIWFGDDRHVPRTSPHSNLVAIDEVLLATSADGTASPMSPQNIHPWPTAVNGSRATELYLQEIHGAGVEHTEKGVPVFDLVMIGVGSDAHCLSVFPGSPLAASGAPVAAPVPAPQHIEPHVPRLSFSLEILAAARAICATVTGAGKSTALSRIIEGTGSTVELPARAALISTATWIIDRAAASGLRAPTGR